VKNALPIIWLHFCPLFPHETKKTLLQASKTFRPAKKLAIINDAQRNT